MVSQSRVGVSTRMFSIVLSASFFAAALAPLASATQPEAPDPLPSLTSASDDPLAMLAKAREMRDTLKDASAGEKPGSILDRIPKRAVQGDGGLPVNGASLLPFALPPPEPAPVKALPPTTPPTTETLSEGPSLEALTSQATQYVIGFTKIPEGVTVGSTYNGDTVIAIDETLHFIVLASSDVRASLAHATELHDEVLYSEADLDLTWIEAFVPDDPSAPDQYALEQVRLPDAWETSLGSIDAAVCVIDTGVRMTHEDLGLARYLGGYDFYNNDATPTDDNGHGTHVAGIAAAEIDNATGIAGAGNVGYYAVKVLGAHGGGSFTDIAAGIRWCADNTIPRTVISLSLGASIGSAVVRSAVEHAAAQGKVVVAAAGNDGPCTNCVGYPARYEDVIAVSCTDDTTDLCDFSSQGPDVDVAAPGSAILSTYRSSDTSYATLSGTSMSTPYVSGALALAWSANPDLTAAQLRARLENGVVDLGAPGLDVEFGHGQLDAACLMAGTSPCTDLVTPVLRDAFVSFDMPTTITLEWSEILDAATAPAAEDIALLVGDAGALVTGTSVEGNLLFVDLDAPLPLDLGVVISYTPGTLADPAGNLAEGFATAPVDTSALLDEEGGPDAFGYTYVTSAVAGGPAFEWFDATPTAEFLTLSDDDVSDPVELPFTFPFYGKAYRELVITSNGFVSFDLASGPYPWSGQALPDSDTPNTVVAPLWTDLLPPLGGSVWYDTVGEPGSRVFLVTWEDVPNYGDWLYPGAGPNSFQLQIREADHAIEAHYLRVAPDAVFWSTPSIGIENETGEDGLLYVNDRVTFTERAIRFETDVAQLVPDFEISEFSGITGETLTFTDLSPETDIAAWSWAFGDGATSDLQHPTHVYEAPGIYTVTLTITNGDEETGSISRKLPVLEPGRFPLPMVGPAIATDGEESYLLGGYAVPPASEASSAFDGFEAGFLSSIYVYNTTSGELRWTGDTLPFPTLYATAAWTGEDVYVFGNYLDPMDQIVRYDPVNGATEVIDTPLPRLILASSAYDPRITPDCPEGCIYLFGGLTVVGSSAAASTSIYRFDIWSEEVVEMDATLSWGSVGTSVALIDDMMYLAGGVGDDITNAIVRYDPIADEITVMDATLPDAVYFASAATDGDHLFVAGGFKVDAVSSATYRYDPAHDEVVVLADALTTPVALAPAVWANDQVTVFGGANDDLASATIQHVETDAIGAFAGPTLDLDASNVDGAGTPGGATTTLMVDLSGRANHATLVGGPTFVGDGSDASPHALQFDGVDDRLNTTTAVDLPTNFTLSVRFRTSTPDRGILAFYDAQHFIPETPLLVSATMWIDADGRVIFDSAHADLATDAGVADGAWHTVEVVVAPSFSPDGASIYLDGVLQERAPSYWVDGASTGFWWIGHGATVDGPNPFFAGEISDVTVYDRSLLNSELRPSLHSAVVFPGTPDIVSLRFSETLDVMAFNPLDAFEISVDGVPGVLVGGFGYPGGMDLQLATPIPHATEVIVSYDPGETPALDRQGSALIAPDLVAYNLVPDPGNEGPVLDHAGGYTFTSNLGLGGAPYEFIDISETGEPALAPNTGSWALPIGFDFDFYGDTYANVHLSATGALSFGKEMMPSSSCVATPDFAGVLGVYSDFDAPYGSIRHQTIGTPGERVFIAQWEDVLEWGEGPGVTFQIRLYEADDSIAVAYEDVILSYGSLASECPARAGIHGTQGLLGLGYRNGIGQLTGLQVVYEPLPTAASFAPSQDVPLVDEPIQFLDTSLLGVDIAGTWWDFGDGTTSDLAAPEHAFAEPGVYVVQLNLTDVLDEEHRAALTIEVVAPGSPLDTRWSGGFVYGDKAYQLVYGFMESYSGLGASILEIDVKRGTVVEAEAEVPWHAYQPSAARAPGGGYFFGGGDPDYLDPAIYWFDGAAGTVTHVDTPPMTLTRSSIGWDPRVSPDCPEGCLYISGGDIYVGSFPTPYPLVLQYSPALRTFIELQDPTSEGWLFAAVSAGAGSLRIAGGYDIAVMESSDPADWWTDIMMEYDVDTERANILPETLPSERAGPGLLWTGERFIIVSGETPVAEGGFTYPPDIWSYDPFTGEMTQLGTIVDPHLLGVIDYNGDGVVASGGGGSPTFGYTAVHSVEFFDLPPQGVSFVGIDDEIVITYSEALPEDFAPVPGDYEVAIDGVAVDVLDVVVEGLTVTLTIDHAIVHGEIIRLGYTPPASVLSTSEASDAPMALGDHPIANPAPPAIVTTPEIPDGLDGWFNVEPTVSIDGEGEAFYCIGEVDEDCTPLTPYTGPFELPEGMHDVRVRSLVDDFLTDIEERPIDVDLTAPTVVAGGSTGSVNPPAAITFTFSEPMDPASTLAAVTGASGWALTFDATSTILTATGALPGAFTLAVGTGARDEHGVHLASGDSRSVTIAGGAPAPAPAPFTPAPPPPPPPAEEEEEEEEDEEETVETTEDETIGEATEEGEGVFAIVLQTSAEDSVVTASFADDESVVDEIAADVDSSSGEPVKVKISVEVLTEVPREIPPPPSPAVYVFEAKVTNVATGAGAAVRTATIRFTLTPAQIGNADPTKFVLTHYHNGVWVPLPTEYIPGTTYQFSAVTGGFSVFALAIDALAPNVALAFKDGTLSGKWRDDMSGVDPKSLVATVGSRLVEATSDATGFTLALPKDLATGLYLVVVKVKDRAGNLASEETRVEIAATALDTTPRALDVKPDATASGEGDPVGRAGTTGNGTTEGGPPGPEESAQDPIPSAGLLVALAAIAVAMLMRRRRS